jgi:hypothetical protein
LEKAGLIVKTDPGQPLPAGLPQREKKLVRRQMSMSIWLPDMRFYNGEEEFAAIQACLEEASEEIEELLKRAVTVN